MEYTAQDVGTRWRKDKGVFYVTVPGRGDNLKSSGKKTREEAIAWALLQARGGLAPEMTVAAFCTGFFVPGKWDYLNEHPGRSDDYWSALQTEVDTYIIPKWGALPMARVEPSSVHAWLGGLLSARSVERGHGKPLAPRSRLSILSTMNVLWNWAVFKGVIPSNPLSTIPKPERVAVKRKAFRLAELVAMFPDDLGSVWPGDWGLFFMLLAETGCRPQEVCALTWEDWREAAKVFMVSRAVDRHNGTKDLKTARHGVAKKAVPISNRLAALLTGGRILPAGPIFHRPDGLPYRVDTAGDIFVKVLDRPTIRPPFAVPRLVLDRDGRTQYSLRHAANTRMRTMLGDEITRAIMGHTTEGMTRRYDDPDEEEMIARVGR